MVDKSKNSKFSRINFRGLKLDLFRQNVEVCLFQNLVLALDRIRKME